jgi:hypothetical protein
LKAIWFSIAVRIFIDGLPPDNVCTVDTRLLVSLLGSHPEMVCHKYDGQYGQPIFSMCLLSTKTTTSFLTVDHDMTTHCAEAKCGGAETEKTADRQPARGATKRTAASGVQ